MVDIGGRAIGAQTEEDGGTEQAVVSKLSISDLGDEQRLHPTGGGVEGGWIEKGAGLNTEGGQAGAQIGEGWLVEATADAAGVDETALRIVVAKEQGADAALAPPLPDRVATNDELGPARCLDLQPITRAPTAKIWAGALLCDDALEAVLDGGLKGGNAIVDKVLDQANVFGGIQGTEQKLLAALKGHRAEVVTVQVEKVEDVELHGNASLGATDIGVASEIKASLEALKGGAAVRVEGDKLAVKD
jgi:hypothetical protein